ncbi:hypothetical protein VNI00_012225 [Paramarasmius palmivorus]|uniref:Hydrophobic surface binding protein n=1 Tax=Paramarasmius palmivorus TaxID=297713 RepID=A0AAW0C7P9_9AGAR
MAPFTHILLFFLAATFAVSVSIPLRLSIDDVKTDLSKISDQVTSLNGKIQAFPDSGGKLSDALAIHQGAQDLAKSLDQGTTDVKNTPSVSEFDGEAILDQVQGFQPTIISALEGIAQKRKAFDSLPVAGITKLAKQDLAVLSNSTGSFENALIAAAPTDALKSKAQSVADSINQAIAKAQAAYANA